MRKTTPKTSAFLVLVVMITLTIPQAQATASAKALANHLAHEALVNHAEAQPITTEEQEVWDKTMSALRSLMGYWSSVFAKYGRRFSVPQVQPDGNTMAHYDPNTNTAILCRELEAAYMARANSASILSIEAMMAEIKSLSDSTSAAELGYYKSA
jgi:hypothetical protein